MIEESIHCGIYPVEESQRQLAKAVQVINKSSSDDLKSDNIEIEVRLGKLFVMNNYVSKIHHLPGIIEVDILDSFKMLCRRSNRIDKNDSIIKNH